MPALQLSCQTGADALPRCDVPDGGSFPDRVQNSSFEDATVSASDRPVASGPSADLSGNSETLPFSHEASSATQKNDLVPSNSPAPDTHGAETARHNETDNMRSAE